MNPELIDIREAAGLLGISPRRVRAMVQAGDLPARRVGGQWLLNRVDVQHPRAANRSAGRPLSPQNAWGILLLASGQDPDWLGSSARWRLRRQLPQLLDSDFLPRLRRRARRHELRAHPSDLPRLRKEKGVLRSGASAADAYDIDVVAPGVVEAYVSDSRLRELERKYSLVPSERPNVVLHSLAENLARSENDVFAPPAAAAIDLIESGDQRSARAGRELLERLEANWSKSST
jgi:excisionase family DNA binding protein